MDQEQFEVVAQALEGKFEKVKHFHDAEFVFEIEEQGYKDGKGGNIHHHFYSCKHLISLKHVVRWLKRKYNVYYIVTCAKDLYESPITWYGYWSPSDRFDHEWNHYYASTAKKIGTL